MRDEVLILAEPGSTHDGDLDHMLRLVDIAAAVGCDVFKNQWTSSPERMCERRRAPDYLDAYRRIAYPADWHPRVSDRCHEKGLEYACSVYLAEDVATVEPHCAFLKTASFEAMDGQLRAALKPYQDRVIVSAGMASFPEIDKILDSAWAVLWCVSAYPTPDAEANLAAIQRLKQRRPWARIGYSDHCLHPLSGALAIAAGAKLVEFHLRGPECERANPDYAVSRLGDTYRARFSEAGEYVAAIRDAETLLGHGEVGRRPLCEEPMRKFRVGS